METLFQIGQIVVVYQQLYHEFTECLISVAICMAHLSFRSMKLNHPFFFLQRSLEFIKCLKLFDDAEIL
jgi:hypothetical protein